MAAAPYPTGYEVGTRVQADLLGRRRPGVIVDRGELDAHYGVVPERVYVVKLDSGGRFRVPETDLC